MTTTTDRLAKRYDFVLLFDVQDGNPNGDPDAGNLPRIDPQSLQGLVTDGCLKRKIRNAIAVLAEGKPGCDLYFQTQDAVYEKRVLNLLHQSAWDALGLQQSTKGDFKAEGTQEGEDDSTKKPKKGKTGAGDKGDFDKVRRTRDWMCQNFYDVRAFGAVMTTGVNCGQVRGPVQLTFARSVDAIIPLEFSITRKSVTTEKEAADQINKTDPDTGKRFGTITGTMGRKNTVPYGLYRAHGFINPFLARDTGFTQADLDLLWAALKGTMWEIDRSASRGLMATRGLYVFEHASPLGNAPAHELFDRIRVEPLGADAAPRSFEDYKARIKIDPNLPAGVTLHRKVG
ncbi:MAG: type I-C CRISPR-associated protein Cas7/Csd2 [Planctomycetes bacterium]|nr:type I-C CRISPR-associated protein Cas7/Csd2 [Planctomycetota bacterium]